MLTCTVTHKKGHFSTTKPETPQFHCHTEPSHADSVMMWDREPEGPQALAGRCHSKKET